MAFWKKYSVHPLKLIWIFVLFAPLCYKIYERSSFGRETFSLCAEAEQKMAEKRWDYEKDLESKVMTPLQIMLEVSVILFDSVYHCTLCTADW